MSLDDRDWYRDLQRERQGLKPKWQFWRKNSEQHNPYYVKPSFFKIPIEKPKSFHWSLIAIFWVFWLVFSFLVFKFFDY